MPTFAQHLFISYAHIDNQPLTPEQQGWISRFHASLQAILSTRLGGEARIWRDDKLQGNDVFADEIVEQFAETAVIVSIVSPRYIRSQWCTREIREFCEAATENGGLVFDNKARVFKVKKTPVETEEPLPEVVQNLLGYDFYTLEDGTPLELDPAYGEQFSQDYCRKIGKLAWDISQMLKVLEEEQGQEEPEEAEVPTQSIYLAECSYDRMQSWEKLKCELEGHGYRVLPDQPLPRGEAEYVEAVEALIGQCSLSIHLIGEHYGAVPYGPSQKSVVVLQNEIAAQCSREGELRRIVWLPDETNSDSPQQQAFIDALHRDPDVQYGADLITSDLQEVKSQAHSKLKQQEDTIAEKSVRQNGPAVGQKLVYLICNERDRMATVPVRKFLRESGFEVVIPAFEGDAGAVRKANAQLMADCDGVLLFYGAGDEAWKRTLTNELKKMRGRRGGKPLMARHTFLSGPVTADKQELIAMEEPNLINCVDEFSESAMADFMAAMESGEAAA